MKKLTFIPFVLLLLVVASCKNNSPFKGTWFLTFESGEENDFEGEYYENTLWLDLEGKTVSMDDFNNVCGILKSVYIGPGFEGSIVMPIVEAEVDGDVAYVKYRNPDTDELWNATLTFNPKDSTVQWAKGELCSAGKRSSEDVLDGEPMESVNEPDTMVLTKISRLQNFREIPEESVVCKLSDRVYYRNSVWTKDGGEWAEENQLRCVNLSNGCDDVIDVSGASDALILMSWQCEAWAFPDNSGIGVIAYDGGTDFETYELSVIGSDNKLTVIACVSGIKFNPFYGISPDEFDDSVTPSVVREGDIVKVYDPETKQTTCYDLFGKPVQK